MKCPKCGSTLIDVEYADAIADIVDLKCLDCGHEFRRNIEGED